TGPWPTASPASWRWPGPSAQTSSARATPCSTACSGRRRPTTSPCCSPAVARRERRSRQQTGNDDGVILRRATTAVFAATVALVLFPACSNGSTVHRTITAETVGGKAGFSIADVTVTHGAKVVFTVKNVTDRPHGFSIDEFGVQRVVEPGRPVTVRFTANPTGTFRIYC